MGIEVGSRRWPIFKVALGRDPWTRYIFYLIFFFSQNLTKYITSFHVDKLFVSQPAVRFRSQTEATPPL